MGTGEDMVGAARWDPQTLERDAARHASFLEEAAKSPQIRTQVEASERLMKLTAGMSVLDVGCGTGVVLPGIARAVSPGGRVVGVDLSASLLEIAHKRMADEGVADVVELVIGDATALDLPDDSFDVARTERVLMHLDDPDLGLAEMARVVRPGGLVVALEPAFSLCRFDGSDDPEAIEILWRQLVTGTRQPDAGFELYRRMADVGLVERTLVPIVFIPTRFEELAVARYDSSIETAVASGALEEARAREAVDGLRKASAEGRLAGMITVFVGAGRVPA